MLSELLRRQLTDQLSFIYSNLPSFVGYFLGSSAVQDMSQNEYFVSFASSFLYVQVHKFEEVPTDEDGYDAVLNLVGISEHEIDYDEYNDWVKLCKEGP